MFARWRQLFSQGQVTSPSSGSQSTSLNHSGAMQASIISFYCSGLTCHNINSFLSGMSAYYHMDLESFALAPKKGIEESLIQILLFAISYSYHAYLIFDNFLGITTLFSHVQGAQKSAWICDKIALNGQNRPLSVFYAKRGTGLKVTNSAMTIALP